MTEQSDILSRERLLDALQCALARSPHVYAAWLEGADARGHVDAFSDIDLWLDVRDGQEDVVMTLVRETMAALSDLDIDYERVHPHPQIRQAFFHVTQSSPYLLLDLCLQSHGRDTAATTFVAGQNEVRVLFDRADVIRFVEAEPAVDRAERLAMLRQEFELFQRWVEKCLHRQDFLEALAAYQRYTLEPLVTLLRLQYAPRKSDYHLKHSGRDLPPAVVKRLEALYGVGTLTDIADKHPRACAWFRQLWHEATEQGKP